jgi:hypothetical protein
VAQSEKGKGPGKGAKERERTGEGIVGSLLPSQANRDGITLYMYCY